MKTLFPIAPATDWSEDMIQRFVSKIAIRGPDQCWPWLAHRHRSGHGQFRLRGKKTPAQRVAFELATGRPPAQCVLHKCDVPGCCNPAHLEEGTQQENTRQRCERGRTASGENGPNSKLSFSEAVCIALLYASGRFTQKEIAVKFGVRQQTVCDIVRGKKHLHAHACARAILAVDEFSVDKQVGATHMRVRGMV